MHDNFENSEILKFPKVNANMFWMMFENYFVIISDGVIN